VSVKKNNLDALIASIAPRLHSEIFEDDSSPLIYVKGFDELGNVKFWVDTANDRIDLNNPSSDSCNCCQFTEENWLLLFICDPSIIFINDKCIYFEDGITVPINEIENISYIGKSFFSRYFKIEIATKNDIFNIKYKSSEKDSLYLYRLMLIIYKFINQKNNNKNNKETKQANIYQALVCSQCGATNTKSSSKCEYCDSQLPKDKDVKCCKDNIQLFDYFSYYIDDGVAMVDFKLKNIGETIIHSIYIRVEFLNLTNETIYSGHIKPTETLDGEENLVLHPGEIYSRDFHYQHNNIPSDWDEYNIRLSILECSDQHVQESYNNPINNGFFDNRPKDEFEDDEFEDDEFEDDEFDDEFDDGLDERYPSEINEEKLVEQRDDGMWYRFDTDDLYTGPWGKGNDFIKNGQFVKK
jgi:ribosomal protein L40E